MRPSTSSAMPKRTPSSVMPRAYQLPSHNSRLASALMAATASPNVCPCALRPCALQISDHKRNAYAVATVSQPDTPLPRQPTMFMGSHQSPCAIKLRPRASRASSSHCIAASNRSATLRRCPSWVSTIASRMLASPVSARYALRKIGSHTQWSVCGTWLMYFSSAPSTNRMPSGIAPLGSCCDKACSNAARAVAGCR